MSYDPCHAAATNRITQHYMRSLGPYHEVVGNSEYELKLNFDPPFTSSSSSSAIYRGKNAFLTMMKSFQSAASGNNGTMFDPAGFLPNHYILVSLGLDTVKTLPMAEFFLNDLQLRLRFPLFTNRFDGPVLDGNLIDISMKDRLSTIKRGEHRVELEKAVQNPLEALREFKDMPALPDRVKRVVGDNGDNNLIQDDHLRVSEVCMTSRVGFFMISKVPDAEAHVLLHGCFDVSRFSTPCMDIYTKRTPRIEAEFEVKAFFGDIGGLETEAIQKDVTNRIFREMSASASNHNFEIFEHSKMEDAANSVAFHYKKGFPELEWINSPIRTNVPTYLAHALMQGKRVSDVFNSLHADGRNNSLYQLAAAIPHPQDLLQGNDNFLKRAVA